MLSLLFTNPPKKGNRELCKTNFKNKIFDLDNSEFIFHFKFFKIKIH